MAAARSSEIAKHAAEFAANVRNAAKMAESEMDVQVEAAAQLRFLEKATGAKFGGKHNVTIGEGRPDTVYHRIIVEYKNPSDKASCIGPTLESPGTKKVVDQIKKRFGDLQTEMGQPINSLFGVGCDGLRFVFIRWRDKKWDVQPPVDVDEHSAERFLWALFNLSQKGKPYKPEYLAGDFGSDSTLAQEGVRTLYKAIRSATHPKAQTFFNQWKILFGEVCGYDVNDPNEKMATLAKGYGITGKVHPAELLFAVHTYYAVFMKLLAAGIVARFHGMETGGPLAKLNAAPTPAKFKMEMEDLEKGSVFRHFNITNFLEGDLFAWYLPVWSDDIHAFLKAMAGKLDEYVPETLAEEPTVSRDLLKKLYQELFPKKVRHDLGEYYTPDWLAEHTLNEVGYDGDPDKRILDPACGSGTFLVMAINRIRGWYEANREKCGYEASDLGRKILSNCIGFDLNPLAVMAARTNYLIAIRGLIDGLERVEIPVYLCDSILTPSSYGGLFAGETGASKELKTAAAKFIVPVEIASSASEVGRYAEVLEVCVKNGYSSKEFLERCGAEGLKVTKDKLHTALYQELVALDKANKNGVWARIIKNSFAPLFVGKVDIVVGNPPWINWENLPESYRKDTVSVWQHYGLKDVGFGKAAIGKSKHEIAGLFLYVSADHYAKPDGSVAFVVTQSLFKNKGAAGFRQLKIGRTWLRPQAITDMVECGVFEGAVNRTATIVVSKQSRIFDYPVDYACWFPRKEPDLPEMATLEEVKRLVLPVAMKAFPADQNDRGAPWLTCPEPVAKCLKLVLGRAYFRAFEGVNSGGLVGAYWMRKVKELSAKTWLMENLGDAGKIKVPIDQVRIERDLLYPFIRGRDVKRWRADEFCQYLLTHDGMSRQPLAQGTLKTKYPHAWDYLLGMKPRLLKRKTAPVRQQMDEGFFYAILGIGPHTMSPWKVVFKDLTELFQCCVIGPEDSSDQSHTILPDCTLRLIPAGSEDEAHYIAAMLNSAPSVAALYYSSAGVQTQRYHAGDAEKIAIGAFTGSREQKRLATLSKACHKAARLGNRDEVQALEAQIDVLAALFWGVDKSDAERIRLALAPIEAQSRMHSSIVSEDDGE